MSNMENQNTYPTSQLDSNTILVILLLIFAFPIGIVLMWILMKHWPKWMKWVITAPMIIIPILYILLFSVLFFVIRPSEQLQKAEETRQKSEQIKEYYNTQLSLTPTPATTDDVIPSDWTSHTSNDCAIALPIPPKKTPYYIPPSGSEPANIDEGGFWQYREYIFQEGDISLFEKQVSVIFSNPDAGGSEYMAGRVSVSCAQNIKKMTTEQLTDEVINLYNAHSGESKASLKQQTTILGKVMNEVAFNGGMNQGESIYLYADTNNIYDLSTTSMSTNPFIKQTTKQIFNHIKFN